MSDEYELVEESMGAVEIGNNRVRLIRAIYPDEPTYRERQWHAFCVEYLGELIPKEKRVRAADTSFYLAASKAVDAYSNQGEDEADGGDSQ